MDSVIDGIHSGEQHFVDNQTEEDYEMPGYLKQPLFSSEPVKPKKKYDQNVQTPLMKNYMKSMKIAADVEKQKKSDPESKPKNYGMPKPIKLGDTISMMPTSNLLDWFSYLEMLMEPYEPDDKVKILTLRNKLPEDILIWLSTLPAVNRITYDATKYTILCKYKNENIDGADLLEKFLNTYQLDNQTVSSYSSTLINQNMRLKEHGQIINQITFKNTFLRGLLPKIQDRTRLCISTTDNLEEILAAALKSENDIQEMESARKLRTRNNINNNSNSATTPQIMLKKCACGKQLDNLKHKQCKECFQKNGNKSAKDKIPKIVDASKYIHTQVEFMKCDNNSNNPYLWKAAKLKADDRCFFCADKLAGHTTHSCSDKYKNYKPDEVRILLFNKLVPPTRTAFPAGPRSFKVDGDVLLMTTGEHTRESCEGSQQVS